MPINLPTTESWALVGVQDHVSLEEGSSPVLQSLPSEGDAWGLGGLFYLPPQCLVGGRLLRIPRPARHLATASPSHVEALSASASVSSLAPAASGSTTLPLSAHMSSTAPCKLAIGTPHPEHPQEFPGPAPLEVHRLAAPRGKVYPSLPALPRITTVLNPQHLGWVPEKASIHLLAKTKDSNDNRQSYWKQRFTYQSIAHILEHRLK